MIYIAKHSPYLIRNLRMPTGYVDIGVGKMFEHRGDNINYLNPYLNEVTALYDIWKNTPDEFIGMCHYRRFFQEKGEVLSFAKAVHYLRDAEIVTTLDHTTPVTLEKWLAKALTPDIFEKYVPMFPEDFQKWIKESDSYNICNMFVADYKVMNEYCEWLFPMIIPIAEQFMREDANGDFTHDRALGFICEMLFAFWCKDKNRKQINFLMA